MQTVDYVQAKGGLTMPNEIKYSEGDYHSTQYSQISFNTWGGDLMVDIMPEICPIGRYSCKRWMIGIEDYQLEYKCINLVHFGNGELICEELRKHSDKEPKLKHLDQIFDINTIYHSKED